MAGDSSVVRSFEHPENSLQSNATGFLNVLNLVKTQLKNSFISIGVSKKFWARNII